MGAPVGGSTSPAMNVFAPRVGNIAAKHVRDAQGPPEGQYTAVRGSARAAI
jgi:hypothetical protein